FDTMGTAIGVGKQAGFVDEKGDIPRIRGLLVVDSLGALCGGLGGCSSVTCYVESAAGVSVGGRTGLTSLVTGAAFLVSLFFIPLVGILGGGVETGPGAFAYPITAPALIIVGFMMCGHVGSIRFNRIETGLPAFLILSMIPLTASISHGLAFGFISYCLIQAVRGRWREVHPLLYVVAVLFFATLAAR
ncbi:MAG: NCS2 family permease, partial [Candidatus Sumerlaeota bacterium]|nr:NCS2 family permease [Candidatus Sumerlaeota bacterium]